MTHTRNIPTAPGSSGEVTAPLGPTEQLHYITLLRLEDIPDLYNV